MQGQNNEVRVLEQARNQRNSTADLYAPTTMNQNNLSQQWIMRDGKLQCRWVIQRDVAIAA